MSESFGWNPWHGCRKISPGCKNCYVYRIDASHGRDASEIRKTADFGLPLRRNRAGEWKIPDGSLVYTCFSSDFLLKEADGWRAEAWDMMRQRPGLRFLFITKRIDRLESCLPPDWGNGWENVEICCTCENQEMADFRLPIYRAAPIVRKTVVCEPLLGYIDLSNHIGPWLAGGVIAGGESGEGARLCRYDWILDLRRQCAEAGVPFHFKQTGALFEKDGRVWRIPRRSQHPQAKAAGIDHDGRILL